MLYCHDGPLFKDENGAYYSLGLSNEVFERYEKIVDKIELVIRVKEIKAEDIKGKMSPITLPYLSVTESPNLSTLKGLAIERSAFKKELLEKAKKADYIFCRIPSHVGNVGVDVAEELNIPYMVEVVACPWDSLWNYSLKGKMVAPYFTMATKKRVRSANYAVYVTNQFLQRRYPTKGKSTNCSNVILETVSPEVLERRLSKIETTSNKIIIGTTASVDIRFKGQQYIIEALGELKKRGNVSFEYQLVGKGDNSYLKAIAKKFDVEDQVKFLGPKTHKDVFDWLDSIDFYAQPSRQEGLPRALIEAMSRGLPALGAKTGGIPELLNDDFIISNSKNNISEISYILSNLSKEKCKQEAMNNFNESKKYLRSIIEERRQAFLQDFVEGSK